jgi:ABC-2 type transport system ATP-binding protein
MATVPDRPAVDAPPDATIAGAPGGDPAAPPGAVVRCEELVVRYGATTAVDGLSFVVGAGEVVALLGPNGAGKTSTLETLMGYRRPSGGRVRVGGLDPVADHAELVRRTGVMLQGGGIYPVLGPHRALHLFASYYDEPLDPDDLLDVVALGAVARTPWRHLSGGEQQRLSLALALIGRPDVLFLDEPTAGVDPEGRQAVRRIIEQARDRGACVLLTTHELPEAERLADRVVIVHHGRLAAEGAPRDLAAPAGGEELRFGAPAGLDVESLAEALGAAVVERTPGRYAVAAPASPALTARLAGWLVERDATMTDLRSTRSLEEAYLELVGAEGLAADSDAGTAGPSSPAGRRRGRRDASKRFRGNVSRRSGGDESVRGQSQ